jgi:hypothetical protein
LGGVPSAALPHAPAELQTLQVPQETVLPGNWHAPAPSQVPPQVPVPVHSFAGSAFTGTGQQVPSCPATLQAWHRPVHALAAPPGSLQQ